MSQQSMHSTPKKRCPDGGWQYSAPSLLTASTRPLGSPIKARKHANNDPSSAISHGWREPLFVWFSWDCLFRGAIGGQRLPHK